MPDWESFKSYFRSKSSNRERYVELRGPISDNLGQVELILFARGTGFLPASSLDDIQLRHETLFGLLHEADKTLDTSRAQALELLGKLTEPARQLLADAQEARVRAERREEQRIKDTENFYDKLETALALIESIDEKGAPSPAAIVLKLAEELDNLTDLVDQGQVMRAIGLVNGIISPLPALEEAIVSLVALRKRKPTVLTTSESEDLAKWDKEVLAAIGNSDVSAITEPLGSYRAFIVRKERMVEVRETIAGIHPKDRYASMKMRWDDISQFPADMSSPALLAKKKAAQKAKRTVSNRLKTLAEKEKALNEAVNPSEIERADLQAQVRLAREAATTELDSFDQALTEAAKVQGPHNDAMRKYYAELKKLKPRITLADSLPAQVTGVDTAWKAERLSYDLARKAVTDAVAAGTRDFATGLIKLGLLVTAIDTLVNKKLQSVKTAVSSATDVTSGSSKKAVDLMVELQKTPGLVKALPPEQQLALLKTLRSAQFFCIRCDKNFTESQFKAKSHKCPYCNKQDQLQIPAYCADDTCRRPCDCPTLYSSTNPCPDCFEEDWKYSTDYQRAQWKGTVLPHPNEGIAVARAIILSEMELTPEFQEWDQEKREEVVKEIRKDPVFINMTEEQWGEWVDEGPPYAKIVAYATSVLKIQCRIFGHDQKGLKRKGEDFPEIPVKISVESDPSSPDTAGFCKPGFPTWLVLNSASPMFRDFKEVVDTIVHENSHAFQEMLMTKLKGEAPFTAEQALQLRSDDKLGVQAQLFAENDKSYISRKSLKKSGDPHEDLADRAYRHEPLEEHAWTVGGKISRALLVPPPTESFRSRHTLRSKTFHVVSLTREADPIIKLTTRHGIYVDEWEGETAWDKKLFLDGLPIGGRRVTREVEIDDVVDAFTLKLDWDSSGFTEDAENVGHVMSDGMRLRLDERVSDL